LVAVSTGGVGSRSSRTAEARSLAEIRREVEQLEGTVDHHLKVLEMPKSKSRRSLMKRFLDGLVLYQMKDFDKAAVVFMDLVNHHPNSEGARQARFYLAECLYRRREYRTAVKYYDWVVKQGRQTKHYQRALQRLLELSFRIHDHSRVHDLVERIKEIPAGQRDESMEYVLGKYYYHRGLYDRAKQVFASIPLTGKHGDQARYFLGVIAIKEKELKNAESIFKRSLRRIKASKVKGKPLKGKKRRLRDLFIMALARLNYHNDDPDAAIKLYKSLSRRSDQFEQALYELAWAYLRAWEFYRAIKSLEMLVLLNPDSKHVPESKILVGNLRIIARQFSSAKKLFKQTAEDYRPVYHKVRKLQNEHWSEEKFLTLLTGEGSEALDTEVYLPKNTLKTLKRQPQVRRAMRVLGDVDRIKSSIAGCERMIKRVEKRLDSASRISAFPELARARARAVEVEIKLASLRAELVGKLKRVVQPAASAQERAELARLEKRRAELQKMVRQMPTSGEDFERRVAKIRKLYDKKEAAIHKLSVMVQGLEARLTAIKNYYASTRGQQKLDPAVVKKKVDSLKEVISALQTEIASIRASIEDGRSSAGIDDATMREEKRVRRAYKKVLAEQQELMDAIKSRSGSTARQDASRIEAVLQRASSVRQKIDTFNQRIEKLLAFKLGRARRILSEEKTNLASYKKLLVGYEPESRKVAGGVTKESFQEIASELNELLIKADVGILDVAWALKRAQSEKWATHTRRQGKKLQALEERFQEVRRR
jgi:TolA-binding protein